MEILCKKASWRLRAYNRRLQPSAMKYNQSALKRLRIVALMQWAAISIDVSP
ncbi:MAG: hypothetical protein IAB88_08690 [Bacteroidetes bacterium]|uniref:Uncharacterized protein n=1 Tax=Candidatus Limisoma faecipullorum TaxID=2840854 RepID=A0A9D9IQQ4_9BACT|nr:hypothetical protein [Candidatus Limisoma faecipullorum]